MKTIKELMHILPQQGKVEWIGIRPQRKADLKEVHSVQISVESGLNGDHNNNPGGKRMVTLIQQEHIAGVSSIMGKTVSPYDLRRNIVVSGINLLSLHDQMFRIGDSVILKGTGYCVPCSRMEENLGPGGYNAMRGHGGITATVLSGGDIKLGDIVELNVD